MDNMRGLLAPGKRKQYALAGKSTITFVGNSARFTYRIKQALDLMDKPKQMWFVSLLTGSDNTSDYKYIGVIREDGRFGLTAKSKLGSNAPGVQAMIWISRNWESLSTEVWHEGSCGCCGRKLTVPESIASGIGPKCAERGA